MTDYLTDAQNDVQTYFETHAIPTYFHQCFFGELVKVWGARLLIPDKDYDAEYDDDGNIVPSDDEYSYKEQISYRLTMLTGTSGWGMAFREACKQCNLLELDQHYRQIDWVRSDILDGYILDAMLDVLFADDTQSDYYCFKFSKEANNNAMPKMS